MYISARKNFVLSSSNFLRQNCYSNCGLGRIGSAIE